MTTNEKAGVIVELYDMPLTERKDDRYGRVVTSRSLSEDDLISIAVSRRTDLSPTSLKAGMEILRGIALEQIVNGASVSFGLGYFNLSVNGVFVGDNAQWDNSMHSLSVSIAPTLKLRKALKTSKVHVRGMATSGSVINSVTDVTSGEVNNHLTPGGGVNLKGNRLKIEGDKLVGITLVNQATADIIAIPMTSLMVNTPSKISFIVPPALANGTYKISITTQFSVSGPILKNPRTYTSDCVLNVSV